MQLYKGVTLHNTAYNYLRPRSNFDRKNLWHVVAFTIVDFTAEN